MAKKSLVLMSVLVVIMSLGSCMGLPGIGGFDPLGDLSRSVETRASGEVSSGLGVTAMLRKTMFQMVYAQVFFVGGFGTASLGTGDLEETQGALWRYESQSEGESSVVEAERALLKKLPGGAEWWYLAWRTEGTEWAFEVLVDKNQTPVKIRYFNPDVNRVEEALFEDTEAPPSRSQASAEEFKNWRNLSKGKETIKVGAGSFDTEKLLWKLRDAEEKAEYQYTWWLSSKMGGVVKFEWIKTPGSDRMKGELVSLKKGYTTKLSSY